MELFTPEIGLIFWLLIPFLVVFFILAKYAWPAILKGVDKRNQYIDESLIAARQAREELEHVKADSQKLIDLAKKEQADIIVAATKSKEMLVESARVKANEEAAKIITEARAQIALEKEEAIRQIRREVATLSVDIAEKVIRVNLKENSEQMNMIDRLIDEVQIPKS